MHRGFCNFAALTLPIHNGHNAELFKSSLLRIIMCGILVVINFAHNYVHLCSFLLSRMANLASIAIVRLV